MEHPDYPQTTVGQGSQYPPCPYNVPDGEGCECPRSMILYLESEGYDHQTAIGLALMFDATYREARNAITDALGGWNEFNALTDDGIAPREQMEEWYKAHLPLVEYLAERDDELKPYWHQAKYPEYLIPKFLTYSTLVTEQEDGTFVQFQVPGFPLMFSDDQYQQVLEAAGLWGKSQWGPLRIGHVTFGLTKNWRR